MRCEETLLPEKTLRKITRCAILVQQLQYIHSIKPTEFLTFKKTFGPSLWGKVPSKDLSTFQVSGQLIKDSLYPQTIL